MKRGKRPTRAQKTLISSCRLSPSNWLVQKDSKESMTIVHKRTDTVRTIKKII